MKKHTDGEAHPNLSPIKINWAIIRPSLERFLDSAARQLSRDHVYRIVSQAQATPVANKMAEWYNSGKLGNPPGFSDGEIRASIYNQSIYAQQLQAFSHVSRLSCYEHGSEIISSIGKGNSIVPLTLLRGLIERVALAERLRSELLKSWLDDTEKKSFHEAFYSTNLAEVIGKSLYGTRIDWAKLASADFKLAKVKELQYKPSDAHLDVSAGQVLSNVDRLDRQVEGLRIAYEVLCEFLHPNIGDLFGTTASSKSRMDRWGTRHLERVLSLRPREFSGSKDLVTCLDQVLEVSRGMIDILPALHADLDRFAHQFVKLNRKSMHRVRKKQRHLFSSEDLCPCLSGLTVKNCR